MIYLERIYEFYSEINKKAVEWLWYPYIAYGKITLLQGDPGEGKSSIAVHLSAIITTAGVLPDGTRISKPEHVIYQCSEDGLADTVKPRLEMAKANCDRLIHIIEEQGCLTLEDQRLEETISRTNAKLCIIDPLQAYLGNDMDMMNAVKVRNLLRKLSWIAEKYSCAIVLICHMSKSSVKKSLYRCLGSIDIAAVARSILMVLRDKEDLQLRYLLQIKNNLAEEGRKVLQTIEDYKFKLDQSTNMLNGNEKAQSKLEQKKKILDSASSQLYGIVFDLENFDLTPVTYEDEQLSLTAPAFTRDTSDGPGPADKANEESSEEELPKNDEESTSNEESEEENLDEESEDNSEEDTESAIEKALKEIDKEEEEEKE